jgi:hypothetical protein
MLQRCLLKPSMFVLHSSLVVMELVVLARLLEAMSFVTVDSGVAAGVAGTIEAVENAVVGVEIVVEFVSFVVALNTGVFVVATSELD